MEDLAQIRERLKSLRIQEANTNGGEGSSFHGLSNPLIETPAAQGHMGSCAPPHEVSLETIQGVCIGVYQRERQRLLDLLGRISGRVSLSLDLWTSDQTIGYVFITGHFVDDDWKLQRRILDVVPLPFHDSESAFNLAIVNCITDWNLERKMFTLTVDESFANEAVRRNLRGLLSIKNPPVLADCYARVLSRVAQEALTWMSGTIQKVRHIVKYVKTLEVQLPNTEGLVLDNQMQWDTTYHMLVAATKSRDVFSCLYISVHYEEIPSMDEWKQVEILCIYLKILFDAANILTAEKYPTANVFFHEVWIIQLRLTHAAMSEDLFVCSLTRPMKEKFDKYWKDCSLVFTIAVVMDPRFKMRLVEFSFSRIYGEDAERWIRTVDECVHELFLEYLVDQNGCIPKPETEVFLCNGSHDEENLITKGDELTEFDEFMFESDIKSELDEYLEDCLLPRTHEFDVLGWWKVNSQRYPTLSKMASDILCMPVSTVAPDSVFDVAGKKMDSYISSLKPSTVKALICAKDWLQY